MQLTYNRKKIFAIICLLVFLGLIFGYFQKKSNQNTITIPHEKTSWLESSPINHIMIDFVPINHYLIDKKKQILPENIKLSLNKINQQITIESYLNKNYPTWEKFYKINQKTLKKTLFSTKKIIYQPNYWILQHFKRNEITFKHLKEMQIVKKTTEKPTIIMQKLLQMLNNYFYSWEKIEQFIKQNLTKQTAEKIIHLLTSQLWKSEWKLSSPSLL